MLFRKNSIVKNSNWRYSKHRKTQGDDVLKAMKKYSVLLVLVCVMLCACAPKQAQVVQATELAVTTPHVMNATAVATMAKAEEPLVITMSSVSKWESGNTHFEQIDVKVKNTSSTAVTDWHVDLSMPQGFKLEQGWNAAYKAGTNSLSAEGLSYNKDIPMGGEVAFGFIYSGTETGTVSVKTKGITTPSATQTPITTPKATLFPVANAPTPSGAKATVGNSVGDDWLSVSGNTIVDRNGTPVWITGINWFGYNTGTNTFDGLWAANLEESLQSIADHGFNLLRVPFSAQLINAWAEGTYPNANYNTALNPSLNGKNSLQIFDHVVAVCQKTGIKIMIDIHSAKTDPMGHMQPLWYQDDFPVEKYYSALEWMADRYKADDTILAYDLKNEPHGKPSEAKRAVWNNEKSADNWKYTAEQAAQRVLAKNPNVLIMVEGTEIYPKNITTNGSFVSKNDADYYFNWWGGNLRGVKDFPVNLGAYQNKLVYSPHDYGPAVYKQPWFHEGYTFASLYKECWKDSWMYIYEQKTAPLLIGEWGGYMTEPNLTWMTHMRTLIKDNKLNHTFWCYNANSGDTGGMVKDDFHTWDDAKYQFVVPVLWQDGGKFIGLDHQVVLGKNGKLMGS